MSLTRHPYQKDQFNIRPPAVFPFIAPVEYLIIGDWTNNPVAALVNSPRNNRPKCVERVEI